MNSIWDGPPGVMDTKVYWDFIERLEAAETKAAVRRRIGLARRCLLAIRILFNGHGASCIRLDPHR